MAASDVSSLCLACGLCCDGTLFAHVSVRAEEAPALLARDVALGLRKDGSYRLTQRCGALEGTRCRAYAERPGPCRSYVCLLATALEQGEVGLPEALGLVAQAHGRLDALAALLPAPERPDSPAQQVRRSYAGEAPALSEEARTAWEQARDFLRRTFTGRHGLS